MSATRPVHDANPDNVEMLTRQLAEPFDPALVRFKPAVVVGNRALALAYVDARTIQDRLDSVLGVENWQDDYDALPDGSVICRLKLRIGNQWITKVDVGSPSDQTDSGDRIKAAFSDALKRAAVKFGIGRYLYRLPNQWVEWDPQRRQFGTHPKLPASALPELAPQPSRSSRTALPASGAELQRRLQEFESKLAAQGICKAGELIDHVRRAGVGAGLDPDLARWNGAAIKMAVEQARQFERAARQQRPAA
jgi:hypothetical protein